MPKFVLDCKDGEIHLVGGASKSEGTVEICFGNLWGLIAETGWGDHDAEVVCRQLGYLTEGAALKSVALHHCIILFSMLTIGAVSYGDSHFGKPNKTIQASDVTCLGDEKALTECSLTTYDLETGKRMLDNVEVVGVSCQVPKPCASGAASCTSSGSVGVPGHTTIIPTQSATANPQSNQPLAQQYTVPLYVVIGIMAVAIVSAVKSS